MNVFCDNNAERQAIGCALNSNGEAGELVRQLRFDHFDDGRNVSVLRAMRALAAGSQVVNSVSVFEWLRANDKSETNWAAYLAQLPDLAAINFPLFFERLEALRRRRALIRDVDGLCVTVRDPNISEDVLEDSLLNLAEGHIGGTSQPDAARLFNPAIEPPQLRAVYTLDGKPICTPGNLTTTNAPVKTGKSAVMGAMIAATMPEGVAIATETHARDTLGFCSANPEGKLLFHFDSEQSPEDHWWLIHRALKRAGLANPPAWLLSYCLTGLSAPEAWCFVKRTLRKAAGTGAHSVLIDGVADLVSDVNDPAECNAFVAALQGLDIEYD